MGTNGLWAHKLDRTLKLPEHPHWSIFTLTDDQAVFGANCMPLHLRQHLRRRFRRLLLITCLLAACVAACPQVAFLHDEVDKYINFLRVGGRVAGCGVLCRMAA
eukprot:219892-Chlamydomonas_euryale.AAC.4